MPLELPLARSEHRRALITGPAIYRRPIIECGWISDQYEAELGELLLRAILG
jgi:hypothetical protein